MSELKEFLEKRVQSLSENASERARLIREYHPDIYALVLEFQGAKLAWIKSDALTWSRNKRYENPVGIPATVLVLESVDTPKARSRRANSNVRAVGVRKGMKR